MSNATSAENILIVCHGEFVLSINSGIKVIDNSRNILPRNSQVSFLQIFLHLYFFINIIDVMKSENVNIDITICAIGIFFGISTGFSPFKIVSNPLLNTGSDVSSKT